MLTLSHDTILMSSAFITSNKWFKSLPVKNTFVSSANNVAKRVFDTLARLEINRNKSWPRMDCYIELNI